MEGGERDIPLIVVAFQMQQHLLGVVIKGYETKLVILVQYILVSSLKQESILFSHDMKSSSNLQDILVQFSPIPF